MRGGWFGLAFTVASFLVSLLELGHRWGCWYTTQSPELPPTRHRRQGCSYNHYCMVERRERNPLALRVLWSWSPVISLTNNSICHDVLALGVGILLQSSSFFKALKLGSSELTVAYADFDMASCSFGKHDLSRRARCCCSADD